MYIYIYMHTYAHALWHSCGALEVILICTEVELKKSSYQVPAIGSN